MNIFKKVSVAICSFVIILALTGVINPEGEIVVISDIDLITIVIDAGHGGQDPGKVGKISKESDINLAIAEKLEVLLTRRGYMVVMTRTDENGLAPEGEKWSKTADMDIRKAVIESSNASLMLSIHQNSHRDSSSRGAQMFYSTILNENQRLAQILQLKLSAIAPVENKRQIVVDNELKMLRGNAMPSVLAECGFMSNRSEETLLNSKEYQQKIAQALYEGICEFFSLEP